MGLRVQRRALLRGAVAAALGLMVPSCGPAPPPPPPPRPPLPPLATTDLTALLPLAGLRWLVLVRPREIASVTWLIPWIALIAPEDNLARYAAATGVDLRRLEDAAIASYAAPVTLYLARHTGDPATIERLFLKRLTSDVRRASDRPDLTRVSGRLGATPHVLALLGRDVIALQEGGSISRGPARIASLYAQGKLRRAPTALAAEPLRSLAARFGPAPIRALALGPFEGELARGARGLLAGATAIGAAARPSAREGIAVAVAVTGDFSTSAPLAADELLAAWNDLAQSSFGHLLGLDAPVTLPLATHVPDTVAIAVELDPARLARGLKAATSARLDEIMR